MPVSKITNASLSATTKTMVSASCRTKWANLIWMMAKRNLTNCFICLRRHVWYRHLLIALLSLPVIGIHSVCWAYFFKRSATLKALTLWIVEEMKRDLNWILDIIINAKNNCRDHNNYVLFGESSFSITTYLFRRLLWLFMFKKCQWLYTSPKWKLLLDWNDDGYLQQFD